MVDSAGSMEDTLAEMLVLLRSMNGMMAEHREERASAKAATATPANSGAAGSAPPVQSPTPATHSNNQPGGDDDRVTVVGQLSRIVDALKEVGLIRSGTKGDEKTSPFRKKRFGLNLNQAQCGNENYDYTIKYDEDEDTDDEGNPKELSEEARVFWVYNDEAKMFDDDLVAELGDGLDLSLIFSALFSAVLTTFVAQTSQSLSPDQTADSTPHPTTTDLWVNGLWFVSLTLSIAVALFSVLAKQWLRQYMSIVTGTPRERAFIRQFRYDGLMKWRVPTIVGILPIILHLSVVLYLVGLTIFLSPLNHPMAYTVGAMTVLIVVLYIASTVAPLFAHECPYRTTFTDLIYSLHRGVTQHLWAGLYALDARLELKRFRLNNGQKDARLRKLASFDSVERQAASPPNRAKGDQRAEFGALCWLAQTTSSPSAKTVVFESIGAFDRHMTDAIVEAEGILYSSDTVSRAVSSISAITPHRVIRTLVHCRFSHSNGPLSTPVSMVWDSHNFRQEVLRTLAAGFLIVFDIDDDTVIIGPAEGLAWACRFWQDWSTDKFWEVPELVWANLCARAAHFSGSIPLETTPNPLLAAIAGAKWGAHAIPRCLGDGVTMQDVEWEIARRLFVKIWWSAARQVLWRWKDEPSGERARGNEDRVMEWMEICRRYIFKVQEERTKTRWKARASLRLERDSDADRCCDVEWEAAARWAFNVLVHVAEEIDYEKGTDCAEPLKALDIEREVQRWKEQNAPVLAELISELRREKEVKAAAESGTRSQAGIRKWLPRRKKATSTGSGALAHV